MSIPSSTGDQRAFRKPLAFAPRRIGAELNALAPWKVMISDDDDDVHIVSRLMLKDFSFEGRGLQMISARSAAETQRLIVENPDTAVLLLDVVMETEQAGLEVVRHIRNDLKNQFVRIVLRTGQPGQAPERDVVEQFDINDYREKTELTSQRLSTTVMAALRSYRDLLRLETSRVGLEQIAGSSARLFEHQTLRRFARGALIQLGEMVAYGRDQAGSMGVPLGLAAVRRRNGFEVVAGIGGCERAIGLSPDTVLPAELCARVADASLQPGQPIIDGCDFAAVFRTTTGAENLIALRAVSRLEEMDTRLLRVLTNNIGVAFENIYLNREIADTQIEIVQLLSDVMERRSGETSQHTYRVGRCAELLAQLAKLPDDQVELIRQVAPMHDLGKVGIPDAILNKPAALTPEEYEWVKGHTLIGYNILRGSSRPLLKAAAVVCLQHHERWDGQGYPAGLAGSSINLLARVVAIADVFDAVSHNRPYKAAWPSDKVYEFIRDQRGRQFDPELADVFLANFADFLILGDEG